MVQYGMNRECVVGREPWVASVRGCACVCPQVGVRWQVPSARWGGEQVKKGSSAHCSVGVSVGQAPVGGEGVVQVVVR